MGMFDGIPAAGCARFATACPGGRQRFEWPPHQKQTGPPMETKDQFMRIVVIASVILVGALALAVRLHS